MSKVRKEIPHLLTKARSRLAAGVGVVKALTDRNGLPVTGVSKGRARHTPSPLAWPSVPEKGRRSGTLLNPLHLARGGVKAACDASRRKATTLVGNVPPTRRADRDPSLNPGDDLAGSIGLQAHVSEQHPLGWLPLAGLADLAWVSFIPPQLSRHTNQITTDHSPLSPFGVPGGSQHQTGSDFNTVCRICGDPPIDVKGQFEGAQAALRDASWRGSTKVL